MARTCILRAFDLQMSSRLSLVLRLFCFALLCFVFRHAFVEAAALRSIVLRYAGAPIVMHWGTRPYWGITLHRGIPPPLNCGIPPPYSALGDTPTAGYPLGVQNLYINTYCRIYPGCTKSIHIHKHYRLKHTCV